MTMPSERTRALIQTRELLVELAQDPSLSESIRRQARQLLRIIPMQTKYLRAGQLEERKLDRALPEFQY